jgi:RNA-directed DNA polymerase
MRRYFNYHAVPGNLDRLGVSLERVTRLWCRALLDHSETHRLPWTRMHQLASRLIPRPRLRHPYPEGRFAVRYLRHGPYALMSARTEHCGGG